MSLTGRKEGRKVDSTRISLSFSRTNCQVHEPLECVAILGKHQSYISNDWNCFLWTTPENPPCSWLTGSTSIRWSNPAVCVPPPPPPSRPILRLSFADNKLHSDTDHPLCEILPPSSFSQHFMHSFFKIARRKKFLDRNYFYLRSGRNCIFAEGGPKRERFREEIRKSK